MKIDPLANRSLSPPRRKQRAEGAGPSDFAKQLADEAPASAAASGSANLGQVVVAVIHADRPTSGHRLAVCPTVHRIDQGKG